MAVTDRQQGSPAGSTAPPDGDRATGFHPGRLAEVALLFLRLGLTAFGGPAAHVALIEEECVRRRRWLSRERFLDILGAANLIPGPTSTELVMHCGLQRAGWSGLLVAGVCFITPAALMVGGLAALYVRAGELPGFDGVLRAVKPVVVVVVLQALLRLGRTAIRSVRVGLLAVAVVLATYTGLSEVQILLLAGVVHALAGRFSAAALVMAVMTTPGRAIAAVSAGVASVAAAATTTVTVGLPMLFAFFLKTGAVIFGSGYVLFALLEGDMVERFGWLTQAQLLDAIAVGQMTPGPVFTAATFIGYLLGGAPGAAVATVAIFLPAFVFTGLSATFLHRVRNAPVARTFLDGVNAAAVALIAVVLVTLARAALVDPVTMAIAAGAALLIVWAQLNSAWVIVGVAALGWFL